LGIWLPVTPALGPGDAVYSILGTVRITSARSPVSHPVFRKVTAVATASKPIVFLRREKYLK